MKGLIIALIIIILLGGVGGGLTAFGVVPDVLGLKAIVAGLMGETPAAENDAEAPVEPEPEPADYGPEPEFLRVPQLAVPLLAEGVAPKHILLGLRLHVDPESTAQIRRNMTRLQDAYVTALLRTLPQIHDRTGRLDLTSIKAVLNVATQQVLKSGEVYDVIVESAYER